MHVMRPSIYKIHYTYIYTHTYIKWSIAAGMGYFSKNVVLLTLTYLIMHIHNNTPQYHKNIKHKLNNNNNNINIMLGPGGSGDISSYKRKQPTKAAMEQQRGA